MSKAITWVVIVVVVLAGIWYLWSRSHSGAQQPPSTTQSAEQTGEQTSGISSGSSDQELDQDMTQVNAQVNAAQSGSAEVDQSFNDQPIQQTE